jgi:hypothetical protein
MWQALETKARFIAQVMTGQTAVRRSNDVGSHELSYAEVKAIASGNPAVLTLAEADSELQRLAVLKKNHADEQYLATRNLRELPRAIGQLKERLSGLIADASTVTTNADTRTVIADQTVSRDAVLATLAHTLESLPPRVSERRRIRLGQYRGLAFGMILYPHFPPEVFLEGATNRCDSLSRDHHGPRAVLNALERLATSYEAEAARIQQNLAIAEAQLRDYQKRCGEPFPHAAYLADLTTLRDALRSSLSRTSPIPTTEPGPTMLELAERIKELLTGQSIDALPQRTSAPRTSMAAEPITERIRRRIELALTA